MSTTTAPPPPPSITTLSTRKSRSLRELAWLKFSRHNMAMIGLGLLIGLMIFSIGGAFVYTEKYSNFNDTSISLEPPSWEHPFGTDDIGRDILARTIYGGQISLLIGVSAALVEVGLGVLVGALAGYYGGWLDNLLMRFTEAMLTIPSIFLLMISAKFFGNDMPNINFFGRILTGNLLIVIIVIGLTSWMYTARIVRANILSVKELEFITAARCYGAPNLHIIVRHILPNTLAPIIVAATLGVASAILSESYISFLGLGVQGETATWGNILESADKHLEDAPWIWLAPGGLILFTVLAINFVGDGLRDALDPRTRV